MGSNGKRRPPRPSITVVASAAEAAAIAGALERFLYDMAPVIALAEPAIGGWERAAIAEGVGLAPPDPWGDPEPWG